MLPDDENKARRYGSETSAANYREDYELVQRVLAKDAVATRRFCERMRCVPRLMAAANARFGGPLGPEDVADLAQDVVIRALEKLDAYEGRATLETWVGRMGYLELLNRIRRQRGPLKDVSPGILEEWPAADTGGETASAQYGAVLSRLESLDTELAAIVRLKHLDSRTFDEIGELLDLPANTVKTRYHRGLRRFRGELEKSLQGGAG